MSSNFNSRPSARGDSSIDGVYGTVTEFQFTPLREGRQYSSFSSGTGVLFQFTPLREGRRAAKCGWNSTSPISIHAPPRGATEGSHDLQEAGHYFNSRPSARGDSSGDAQGNRRAISIHAPPRGATIWTMLVLRLKLYFNSRPSARGDGRHDGYRGHLPHFNSRPSARGDRRN